MIIIFFKVPDKTDGSGDGGFDEVLDEGFDDTQSQMNTTPTNGTSKAFTSQTPNQGSASPTSLGIIIRLNINPNVSYSTMKDNILKEGLISRYHL